MKYFDTNINFEICNIRTANFSLSPSGNLIECEAHFLTLCMCCI